jgi:hypothetical protein
MDDFKPSSLPPPNDGHQAEDDFLSGLRIDTSFADTPFGVRKALLTVPVRKPPPTKFFRVHPDHHIDMFAIEDKEERGETYFVRGREVVDLVPEFVKPVRLRLIVTRQGDAMLWPVKLPREERRRDDWGKSACEIAGLAERRWLRMSANMNLGCYEAFETVADLGEPRWPEESWATILKIALRDRVIDSEDHAIVRQILRGD